MKRQPQLSIIKPVLTTNGVSDSDFVARLTKVYDGLLNNPAYTATTVDMPSFKAAIDAYSNAITAALDGGKAAKTALEKRRADVTVMFRQLGHYVEAACKGDMNTFVSSGFVAAPKPVRKGAQPVDVPEMTVELGANTSELDGVIKAVTGALHYDLRYAPAPVPGATVTWTTLMVTGTKPPTTISNLTPGTIYTFQVRAFGKLGYSDWSNPVNRMCN